MCPGRGYYAHYSGSWAHLAATLKFVNIGRHFTIERSILLLPHLYFIYFGQSQWPRCLRRWSADVHLLGLRVRIQPGAWISVYCDCCVLSGTDLCVGLISRPEESCRLWCVCVWSWSFGNEEVLAQWGLLSLRKSDPPSEALRIWISVVWFRASYISKWKHQLDATILKYFISLNSSLYMFRVLHPPIIRSFKHVQSGMV